MAKPSNLETLLKTNAAEKLAAVKTAAPEGWQRGREVIGDKGSGATGPMEPGAAANEADLLKLAGFDPEAWAIVGDVQFRCWDANVGGGEIKTMEYRRFAVRKRESSMADLEDLIRVVKRRSKARPVESAGEAPVFALLIADLQSGKMDGDGPEGMVARFHDALNKVVAEYKEFRKRTGGSRVFIALLGDCIEGFVSQGGKNAWRTVLSLTEQLRLYRRLILMAIDAFRKIASEITVAAIPGNHGEAVREPVMTTYDDSYDVDSLVAVQDAMDLNPAAYGHVTTVVPQRDSLTIVMPVGDSTVVLAHGHQFRPGKAFEWWEGQAFEPGADIGKATILLHGHGHHFEVGTRGSRMHIMAPAMEAESVWWKNRTGQHGDPGLLTLELKGGRAQRMTIHRGVAA